MAPPGGRCLLLMALLLAATSAYGWSAGDCLVEMPLASASKVSADVTLRYFKGPMTTNGKPSAPAALAAMKALKGGGGAAAGSSVASFPPADACKFDASVLSDPKAAAFTSLVAKLATTRVGAAGDAMYRMDVGQISSAFTQGKAGSASFVTASYTIDGLQLELTSASDVALTKVGGAVKFPVRVAVTKGTLTASLKFAKSKASGDSKATFDLTQGSASAGAAVAPACALTLRKLTGDFYLDCSALAVALPRAVTTDAAGSFAADVILRGSGLSASGALTAAAAAPKTAPTAVSDAGVWVNGTADAPDGYCTAKVLVNDDVPDWDNTEVLMDCGGTTGFVEVDSISSNARGAATKNGCDLAGGASVGFGTSYAGVDDPLYVPALYQANYEMTYYPPVGYTQAYTATVQYKLKRLSDPESVATFTCNVPAPAPADG